MIYVILNSYKCWKKDLNPQPTDYKSVALPIELFQHKLQKYYILSKSE